MIHEITRTIVKFLNSMNWSDKVVLITGASSGLGRGFAFELAKRGAVVGLLARRADELNEIVKQIEANGGRAQALPADVTDAKAVHDAVDRLRTNFGPVDVLIANAGIGGSKDASELTAADVSKVINVNVIGAANSATAVLPEMVKRGQGRLVAISSLAAYRGLPKSAAYCASKAAVSAFFESLRVDLRGSGVGVTIIHPGFIKTPLTAGREAKMPWLMELDEAVQKMVKAIEARKKSYAFPWQLAGVVRGCLLLPNSWYDEVMARNSLRE
jgi:short-subunit dehydrogenase